MEQLRSTIREMIDISASEMHGFLRDCYDRSFKKKEIICLPDKVPDEIYFVESGIIRVFITDQGGTEHTIHFALENQFICDYSAFIRRDTSIYTLQALEDTRVVVLPRESIEWGYANLAEGDKMGRLIAEFYFIYQDNRIANQYIRTPKQRYDAITEVFPNIHNRVPQHMIASYLGITPIHLSRLKKAGLPKT